MLDSGQTDHAAVRAAIHESGHLKRPDFSCVGRVVTWRMPCPGARPHAVAVR